MSNSNQISHPVLCSFTKICLKPVYKMNVLLLLLVLCITTVSSTTNHCNKVFIWERKSIYGVPAINQIKPRAGRIFVTQTGLANCLTTSECIYSVFNQRGRDQTYLNLPEVRDNFLIGGNGDIYEGVGWASKNYRYDQYPNDLSVAFIGDFRNKVLPEEMATALKHLVLCGVQKGAVDYFFSIYSEDDLSCENKVKTPNGIDYELQKLSAYKASGPITQC